MKRITFFVLAAVVGFGAAAGLNAQSRREAIAVRGHWAIVVRNPDGTIAQRRDFENALTDEGKSLLAVIVGGLPFFPEGRLWRIQLADVPASSSACDDGVMPQPCLIVPITDPLRPQQGRAAYTLSTRVINSKVVLEGSVKATRNGAIGHVITGFYSDGDFTATWATGRNHGVHETFQPVTIVAGQIVQVTVTISFQ
jgi:hypothetical protein